MFCDFRFYFSFFAGVFFGSSGSPCTLSDSVCSSDNNRSSLLAFSVLASGCFLAPFAGLPLSRIIRLSPPYAYRLTSYSAWEMQTRRKRLIIVMKRFLICRTHASGLDALGFRWRPSFLSRRYRNAPTWVTAIACRRLSSSLNWRGWPSSHALRAAFDSCSLVSSQCSWVTSVSVAKSHISNFPQVGHVYLHAASPRKSASTTERHSGQTASDIFSLHHSGSEKGKYLGWRSSEGESHPSCRGIYRFFTARSVFRSPLALLCGQSPIVRSNRRARRFRARSSPPPRARRAFLARDDVTLSRVRNQYRERRNGSEDRAMKNRQTEHGIAVEFLGHNDELSINGLSGHAYD